MRKNQKYGKDEMYQTIELWQESGLSQVKFCSRKELSPKVFCYWLRKYRQEKGHTSAVEKKVPGIFVPVKIPVAREENRHVSDLGRIDIGFPNGVQLSCPAGIDMHQLKTLINL